MTFGLRCSEPACRPHPASLPVRVPAVEGLLRASFSFTSRLRLAFRYGCGHRLRLAPFIQLDSAHAGHTRLQAEGLPHHFLVLPAPQALDIVIITHYDTTYSVLTFMSDPTL